MPMMGLKGKLGKRQRTKNVRAVARPVSLVGLASTLWTLIAHASEDHTYGPNEYALVAQGKAPNGKYSIASHGDGIGGFDHFHIYLMAEPGLKKIGPLEEINYILDTGPKAYTALWSSDSRHVAISYRSNRHVRALVLYAIRNHRAYPLTGPLPSAAVTHGKVSVAATAGYSTHFHLRGRDLAMKWLSPQRFSLEEYASFQETTPDLARTFGKSGRSERQEPQEVGDPPTYWIEFSAQAVCEIVSGDRYRIVSVRPAGFGS
jgi:hypothetical protein